MKTKHTLMATALRTAFITVAIGGAAHAQTTVDGSVGVDLGNTGMISGVPTLDFADSVTNSGLSWEFSADLQNLVLPASQLTGLGADGNPINYEDLLPLKLTKLSIASGAAGAAPTGFGTIIDAGGIDTNALTILDSSTSTPVAISVTNGQLNVAGAPISTPFASLTGIPAGLADGDNQSLSLSTNTLSLTSGGSVNLASVIPASLPFANITNVPTGLADGDDDGQTLSISGNTLSLTNGGSASLAGVVPTAVPFANLTGVPTGIADGDNQTLSLASGVLSLTDGGTADLKEVVPNGMPWANLTGSPTSLTTSGAVTATGDITGSNITGTTLHVNNFNFTGIPTGSGSEGGAQGGYMLWNSTPVEGSGGTGKTAFVNHKGAGSGGFSFSNTADNLTWDKLVDINSSGTLTAYGSIFSTGTVNGSGANITGRTQVDYLYADNNNVDTTAAGSYLAWNVGAATDGVAAVHATNLINSGTGGFYFTETNGTTYTTLAKIDGSGNFTATGNIAGDTVTAGVLVNGPALHVYNSDLGGGSGRPITGGTNIFYNHPLCGGGAYTNFVNYPSLPGGFTFDRTTDGTTISRLLTINSAGNGTFTGSCTATSHPISSDARLKSNVKDISSGLDTVEALRPVSYTKVAKIGDAPETGKPETGLIAQEVQKVLPDSVSTGDDEAKTLAVNYDSLVPILIAAVKEQQAEIKASNAQIQASNAQIQALQAEVEALKK
jgi:hypothetical protein